MTKSMDEKTKEQYEILANQACIEVHEIVHDLIVVLNQYPQKYGQMAMMELVVSHFPFSKNQFMEYVSMVWDAIHETLDETKLKGEKNEE